MSGAAPGEPDDRVPLDLLDAATLHRRARLVGAGGLIVAAAFGGLVGLLGGRVAGVLAAAVVAVPLLLLAWGEARRRSWLAGSVVTVRAFGSRVVDLHQADRLDLLVTDMRGSRTVGLLAGGPPRGKTVNVALAMYAGSGGRALGILPLRRLADALAGTGDARGLVLSELLVAELRAEARGESLGDRPLYRLASLAPAGRLAQRLHPDAVSRFVATLD
ncbi:hypothetical protein [Gandjariella thermophila]|uniref:Uncharacterized protein n=1 Tax=Gandjariella thermophila TaxID=1931992 RepID=A0A4D4J4D6_9PSEU|nr:hypothetical protein [Gandjariella thermophila]GDY28813.1 hypothetical protein GTS_04460 [Gandjariella thermophila]